MKSILIILMIVFCFLLLHPQEDIVEKVDVDWWVLPLFALDKEGNSATDLTKENVNLIVNGKSVTDFFLMKRNFSILEGEKEQEIAPEVLEREKIAFLIFDISFKKKKSLEDSKRVAIDLIEKSSNSTLFVLMNIDPLSGLQYVFGPSSDKETLINIITKHVIILPMARNPIQALVVAYSAQIVGRKASKYENTTHNEMRFLLEEAAASLLKNVNKHFFFSFESLYYSLNQIRDNKFIFFFSEGLSAVAAKIATRRIGEFYKGLQRAAELLGRSGAVIFIVDPSQPGTDRSMLSGSDSLRSLASESGGKYLRGNSKNVSRRFEKMNRAYYEIGFSIPAEFKKEKFTIDVQPKQKGVRIHTLKTIEKKKVYSDMGEIEREVLVLNLLDRNKFFRSPLTIRGFYLLDHNTSGEHINLNFELPGKYKMKTVDVFLVYSNPENNGDIGIQKKKQAISGNKINLKIENEKLKNTKIVMINEKNSVAFVDDFVDVDDQFSRRLRKQNKEFDKQAVKMSVSSKAKLKKILKEAADYCNKLDSAVFHYVCREEINETIGEVGVLKHKTETKYDRLAERMVSKRVPGKTLGNVISNKKKYLYDYQLIQNGDQTIEQRKRMEGGKDQNEVPNMELRLESFLSKKIAMTPLALFDILSQTKFKFRLLKHEKIKGINAEVVEVFPIDYSSSKSIYGKVWIDQRDHSILRIEVNPVSIGGFRNLYIRSGKIGGRLDIKCSIEFNLKRDGVRFPTSVIISERYYGGRLVKNILGLKYWEKNRIEYKYTDYKFFDVDTEVRIQE